MVWCRVVLAEHLLLKEQVQIVSQSDIVIMNHGAAMGNIMFMAPVSAQHPATFPLYTFDQLLLHQFGAHFLTLALHMPCEQQFTKLSG